MFSSVVGSVYGLTFVALILMGLARIVALWVGLRREPWLTLVTALAVQAFFILARNSGLFYYADVDHAGDIRLYVLAVAIAAAIYLALAHLAARAIQNLRDR